MTGNPLSGHTKANESTMAGSGTFTDGLTDGDHIQSPTLTNYLEGIHGNGILLEEDTAKTASNKNVPEDLPGVCEQVTNVNRVRVTGGSAVIDGVLYEFAGGPGGTLNVDLTTDSAHRRATYSALTSGQEALIVVYVSPKPGVDCIQWELGTPITTATNAYPLTPSAFLSDPDTLTTLSSKQSIVLAVLRVVYNSTSGGGDLDLAITESNDKRVFIRPSPIYFTPVTSGAVGAVNAPVDDHAELDTQIAGATGDLAGSRFGALWQSHGTQLGSTVAGDNQKDVLYYTGTHAARFTRSVFDRVLTSAATALTLTSTDANILILTPTASTNIITNGPFPAGYIIHIRNLDTDDYVRFALTSSSSSTMATNYQIDPATCASFVCTVSHATYPTFGLLMDDTIDTPQIAANAVTLAKMAGIARGKIIIGDASGDPAVLAAGANGKLLVADANGDPSWTTVSGDVTISAGAVTIAANAVEGSMLNDDVISGQGALGGAAMAQADLLMIDDGPGTVKKITFSNFEDSVFGNVSGDATVAAGGALTIASTAIQDGMLDDDVAAGLAGAGSTATSGVINVIGGDGITANANDVEVTPAQTTITSVINSALVLGRDAHNDIDFTADNVITFRAANVDQVKLIDNVFGPVADSDVDLGTTSLRWKDAFIDTITTTGDVDVLGNIELGHATDTTLTRASAGDVNIEGNIIYRAGGTDVASGDMAAASATAQGAVELATSAETITGTDAARAVTPDGLADWTGGNSAVTKLGTIATGTWAATDIAVSHGGTGVSTFTDGGVLLGSGTGAITAMAVLTDGQMIVGDGTTDPVAEGGATLRTSIGVGTGDSPQLTGIELGHATDTTLTRASAGDVSIEGNIVYRAGGTDVASGDIADNAITLDKMAGGTDGNIISYDTSGNPVAVATGNDGQVLTSAGAGAVPTFETLPDIAAEEVTLAMLAHAAANTVLVRDANSAGDPSFKAVTNTQLLIGDGTGFTAAALSGDVTMTNAGVVTIGNDKIDSQHYAAASIDNEHLADDAVGADELAANAVVDASVAASAAITFAKLEDLDSTKILVGNGSNVATEVAVSGDVTMANTGAITIAADAVTYAKIQDVSATDRILGRDSSGAGIVEEIAPADVRTMLNVQESVSALFNDIDADISVSGVGSNALINNWDFTSGLAAINSAMSSGVFTTTAALAGKYVVIVKVQYKQNGLTEGTRNHKLQILNYRNDGGGTPEDGTLVSFARVMNANYFNGYILETTAVIDLADTDTFGVYAKIAVSSGSGTWKIASGSNAMTSLTMIKIA